MRIAIIVPGFSANENDWGIPALRDFVSALTARHAVHVFAMHYPYRRDVFSCYGATVHSFNGANRGGAQTIGLWSQVIQAVVREGRRARWDVIHAFFGTFTALCATISARLLRAPVVLSLAGGEVAALPDIRYGDQLSVVHHTMLNFTTLAAARISVGSRYMLALARQHLPRSVYGRLAWAPLGVDPTRFSPAERHAQEPRVLQVASTHPVKDPSLLLRVFERVAQACPTATLEVIGRGWSDERPQSRVCARGEIPHDQLPAVYRRASVYLQTSRHEAQGMSVLEAAASGIPIVGTPVGALPELATNAARLGKTEMKLAHATIDLLRDPVAAMRMGLAARERVCDHYSIEKCTKRFEAIYEDVG